MLTIYSVSIFATNCAKNAMCQPSKNKANNTALTTQVHSVSQIGLSKKAMDSVFRPPQRTANSLTTEVTEYLFTT